MVAQRRTPATMESIIKTLLGDYIKLFFKNFDYHRDLNVKLGKGEAHLNNIRTEPLDYHGIARL